MAALRENVRINKPTALERFSGAGATTDTGDSALASVVYSYTENWQEIVAHDSFRFTAVLFTELGSSLSH